MNGVRTEQMTAVRKFASPELPLGKKFYYTFVSSYLVNGELVTKRKQVEVSAGADLTVDMPSSETITAPKSKPAVMPNPFEVPKADAPKPAAPKPAKPEINLPFVPTPLPVVKEMLKLAKVKSGDVVFDLGGSGRIAIAAVKDFQAKKGIGIDFNPERVKESEAAAKAAGVEKKVEFLQGDVLKLTAKDFDNIDVVTLDLIPKVNQKLKPVLLKGLKPGARVVSHDFDMGSDWKPEQTSTVKDSEGIEHKVFLWTIKK